MIYSILSVSNAKSLLRPVYSTNMMTNLIANCITPKFRNHTVVAALILELKTVSTSFENNIAVFALGRKWCKEHFKCFGCDKRLSDDKSKTFCEW
jgi:hypothetical protein